MIQNGHPQISPLLTHTKLHHIHSVSLCVSNMLVRIFFIGLINTVTFTRCPYIHLNMLQSEMELFLYSILLCFHKNGMVYFILVYPNYKASIMRYSEKRILHLNRLNFIFLHYTPRISLLVQNKSLRTPTYPELLFLFLLQNTGYW